MYACGEGTGGRLGLGHCSNIPVPRQVTALSQYVVKKVAVHSGGRHAMALTVDGKVREASMAVPHTAVLNGHHFVLALLMLILSIRTLILKLFMILLLYCF